MICAVCLFIFLWINFNPTWEVITRTIKFTMTFIKHLTNFKVYPWNLGMDREFHTAHYDGCISLFMLGLRKIHIIKRCPIRWNFACGIGEYCTMSKCRVVATVKRTCSFVKNSWKWVSNMPLPGGWATCPIRTIADCACAGNVGSVFPSPRVSDLDMHHARAWRTCRDACRDR